MAFDQAGNGWFHSGIDGSGDNKATARHAQTRDAASIEAWLIGQIADLQGIEPAEIDSGEPLDSFGLSSREAIILSGDLEDWLDRRLSPTLFYEYPTIKALASHLAEGVGEQPPSEQSAASDQPPADARASQRIDERQLPTEQESIAIVGIGCRFPGADNPDAFWRLLHDGVDAIGEIPSDRWNLGSFYDPTPATPGKMSTRWGGFLERVDEFDARFFGIAPREVSRMDPQQRLLLEVAWEALEDAGQAPDRLAGSRTGVFIGISSSDYALLQYADRAAIDAYAGTGSAASIAANRLSYVLDLRGPSIAIDTACSSSLVAVHLACQSLRSGESRLALAGGVNLILAPELTITFSQARMMAADGRCKTFDASADGYVRSEGCGVVVLKRLSDALEDGDTILGLIRGSAINQDGRSNGLTAPNGQAQQAVIRSALQDANVSPSQIDYIEAHGTGTNLGDPIEVHALEALLAGRSMDQPCVIGSVKTNIGHLEAAAGIAGLIKVVLALTHEMIPAHLHLRTLNPLIALERMPLTIATERRSWTAGNRPRLAGVSSFGFGGANAHVVLEEAPRRAPERSAPDRPLQLLSLSAKDVPALRELTGRFARHLTQHPNQALADICYSANRGRAHFAHRLALTAATGEQARAMLEAVAAGQAPPLAHSGEARSAGQPSVAFLFSGQGAQYVGMGRQLYQTQPTFRATLDRCAEILQPYLDQPLLQVMFSADRGAALLDETEYTQPALFAFEYALAEMWRSWGITPDFVIGHSVGEYVAACVAGVFSLEDGLKLIAARGRLMQSLPRDGSMATVFADQTSVTAALAQLSELGGGASNGHAKAAQVAIAADNGPNSTVVSGQTAAVRALLARLESDGIETRPITVSHAFHSSLMDPILAEFEQTARQVTFMAPRLKLISNLTGRPLGDEEIDAAYWRKHLRAPVQFAAGMRSLAELGCDVFLEIGPQPVLVGMGKRCLPGEELTWLPSLRKQHDDWQVLLDSVGALYVRGRALNWDGFDGDYRRAQVRLPNYPFQRERFWFEPFAGPAGQGVAREPSAVHASRTDGSHPLLGRRILSPLKVVQFESQISAQQLTALGWQNDATLAALYQELALTAATEVFGSGPHTVTELDLYQPLDLAADEVRAVQCLLDPCGDGASFQVFSLADDGWRLHADAIIRRAVAIAQSAAQPVSLVPAPAELTRERLLAGALQARPALLEAYLQARLAAVLRLAPQQIDLQQSVSALGLDSIMAIELKGAIERSLEISTPIASLIAGPSIMQLAEQLLAQLETPIAEPDTLLLAELVSGEQPLSNGQRALWFQHYMASESVYNPSPAVRVRSRLDVPKLRAAFQVVVDRHPALRATFSHRDGEPVQHIQERMAVAFNHEDATGWSDAQLLSRLAGEVGRAFDLERGPLLRVEVFSLAPDDHVIFMAAHHIAIDLWSQAVILNEVGQLYADPAVVLAAPALQYSDYVRWQAEMLDGPDGARLWAYWQQKLAGRLPVLNLPVDQRHPSAQTFSGATHTFQLDAELTQRLKVLSEQHGATLYMTLLAAFKVLLYRYSGQTDIILGTATTGRSRAEFMDLVGYFVNPVALRSDLSGDPRFTDLLSQVRQTVIEGIAHQDYPIALLVEKLQPERHVSRTPLFQVMFVFQRAHLFHDQGLSSFALHAGGSAMDILGLPIESIALEQQVAPFDLTLQMAEDGQQLAGSFTYKSDLFASATIGCMAQHFEALLGSIVASPEGSIARLPLLTPAERSRLLVEFNRTYQDWGPVCSIQELFEAQVARTPDAVAAVFNNTHLTYHELNWRANQLARHLRARGVGPDTLVGICTPRSLELVVGVLGVLKAGGAYVPMDPAYPANRLIGVLEDARAPVLLTAAVDRGAWSEDQDQTMFDPQALTLSSTIRVIDLIADWPAIAQQDGANLDSVTTPDNLAYAIYTSGSTGRPKGVLLHHRGLINLALAQIQAFGVTADSRVLQFASFSFDASVSEIFMALLTGARLYMTSRETLLSSTSLVRLLRDERITTVTFPPSLLSLLQPEDLPDLRTIISAGESCTVELARRWSAGRNFFNAYGPTEATIGPMLYRVEDLPERATSVPIGRPIANTQIYVLDQSMQPVPVGVPGEVYVGGVGVARGYLNRPDLTAEKFVPNPFANSQQSAVSSQQQAEVSEATGERLYRTGDLARYRADGNIEFLGRADRQVKVRGFRIEPGEIESLLQRHTAVQSAVVIAREEAPDDVRLVAYVVPAAGDGGWDASPIPDPPVAELRAYLQQFVPSYMLPSAIVTLDAVPLTPNGKVDRHALPAPNIGRLEPGTASVLPRTELERAIAAIWQDALRIEQISIHGHFFDLGGHSLLLAKVHAQLQTRFEREIPLVDMFRYPTISALAEYLGHQSNTQHSLLDSQDRAMRQREALQKQRMAGAASRQAVNRKRGG
jgi:amino acid adenylation domain-containing protein